MPGPMKNPTKPHSRAHARDGNGMRVLPMECDLPVPRMPKGREWTREDRKLWRSLWRGPQANAWDDSYVPAVAAYVAHASAVYSGTASAWQAQEMRHLGNQLGLTPAGLLSLGWVIADE